MATRLYLESTKAPGLRFRVMKVEKGTMRAQLLGDTGVAFERVLTDDVMNRYGYKLVRVEVQEGACTAS